MPLGPLIEKFKQTFGEKVRLDVLLAPLTTFRIGGPADLLFMPENEQDLQLLMKMCAGHEIEIMTLGGGSNILIADGGIRGITVWMGKGFEHLEEQRQGEQVFVSCGASNTTAQVLDLCVERNIEGFEFAAGIPGTIGGAVRGNSGTRDGAIGNVCDSVTIVNRKGALITLKGEKLKFRYRGLDIEGRFVITRCVLKLRAGQGEKVREKRDKIIRWRKERQPYEMPSAGSVFLNLDKGSAGRLIEQAGCKGMRVGGAVVSEKHANFIINDKNATAADVLALIDQVRRKVFQKFGVLLEDEIRVVGESK